MDQRSRTDELDRHSDTTTDLCEQYPELLAVYLFGSQAEGRAGYFEPEYVQAMTGGVSFRNGTLALLYGSAARQEHTPTSDVDLLIVARDLPSSFRARNRILVKIEDELLPLLDATC